MNDLELYHYGVKGQKWGVRRYQNPDGTLTDAGKRRVYKSLKQYSNTKDRRARMGQAVGEDKLITEAASKLKPARNKYDEALNKYTSMMNKMESEHYKERDRLDKKYGQSKTYDQKTDESWMTIRKKYGAEYDKLEAEFYKQSAEYDKAVHQVVDAYLGKYGDKPVSKLSGIHSTSGISAAEALDTQLNWGLSLGRIKDKKANKDYSKPTSFEVADKAVADVKAEVAKKNYSSVTEKEKALNNAFRKKMREVESTGDGAAADALQTLWANAIDELRYNQ